MLKKHKKKSKCLSKMSKKGMFRRKCKNCGKLFVPSSHHNKLCNDCWNKVNKKRIEKLREYYSNGEKNMP